MNITATEIVEEVNRVFPKEFQIAVQGIQIRKLEELLGTETEDSLLKEIEDGEDA